MNAIVSPTEKSKSSWTFVIVLMCIALIAFITVTAYKQANQASSFENTQPAIYKQQQLLLAQEDVINTNWLRTLNPLVKNVEGRVLWSSALQKGVMEFIGLPSISDKQSYQLWVYDLERNNNKPILAKEFSESEKGPLLISFLVAKKISSPFKFELTLKTKFEELSQPLLLAQP